MAKKRASSRKTSRRKPSKKTSRRKPSKRTSRRKPSKRSSRSRSRSSRKSRVYHPHFPKVVHYYTPEPTTFWWMQPRKSKSKVKAPAPSRPWMPTRADCPSKGQYSCQSSPNCYWTGWQCLTQT